MVEPAITVWGEGRGFRVAWLLEEMGLPYRLRDVDLLAGAENDPEFIALNPGGFIPALTDGETSLVESIAIMQYLLARYGPSSLAPAPDEPGFADYLQFLHLGEAGLAASVFFVLGARRFAPQDESDNWSARQAFGVFASRLRLVSRRLEEADFLAGNRFTAADISVGYALELAVHGIAFDLGREPAIAAYAERLRARPGYARALDRCPGTKSFWGRSTTDRG